MKIKIYTMGGTIDKVYFDKKSTYQIGEPQIQEILRIANINIDTSIQPLLYKDSLEMTERDRELILKKIQTDLNRNIIITHGTDKMIQTAQKLLPIKSKTIVLTGAMQPARFKLSDAEFNIGCAIIAVQILSPGVYITMNGQIFKPDNIVKNNRLNRFEHMYKNNQPKKKIF